MTELPLVRGLSPDDTLGWREGHPVALRRVLQDAHALAARLPRDGYCINLCEDRLNFIVGFRCPAAGRCPASKRRCTRCCPRA